MDDEWADDIASEHFSGPYTMRKPSLFLQGTHHGMGSAEELCPLHRKPYQAVCESDRELLCIECIIGETA